MPDIVDINLITVKRDSRQRRKLEPDPSLQSSIRRVGLINAVVVTKDHVLVAGERRLEACKAIGWSTIPVRWAEDLSTDELKVIELEENVKRKDLTWQDSVRAISELHYLYGRANSNWTQQKTADSISIDQSHVSGALLVAAHLKDPRVAKAATLQEARNLIRRRNERASETEINDMAIFAREMIKKKEKAKGEKDPLSAVSTPPPTETTVEGTGELASPVPSWSRSVVEQTIQQVNFLDWIKSYDGMSFNFIHCDFPYGVNVFSGNGQFKPEDQEGAYSDEAADYWELTECLARNLNHLMSPASHLMFWLSAKPDIIVKTLQIFAQFIPQLEFYPFPLVWHKSDNSGIVGDSQRWPRHTYETALLGYRGKRPLEKIVSDSYSGPGDRRLHPSCKPEPMLRHFFSALIDENTRFLDPTCGAGSSLRAAESLGCLPENVLGLEVEERFVKVARESLLSSRVMSEGSRQVRSKEREALP